MLSQSDLSSILTLLHKLEIRKLFENCSLAIETQMWFTKICCETLTSFEYLKQLLSKNQFFLGSETWKSEGGNQ
jgi:hypothetical protein